MSENISLPTRKLEPAFVDLLRGLKAGERIKLIQTVRVGAKKWTTETAGLFRGLSYLSTGVTVDRVADDDIIVPTVHFTKDNGELSSIALDEQTQIARC